MSEVKFCVWDDKHILDTALWEIKNEDGSLSFRSWSTILSDFLGTDGEFWKVVDGKIEFNKDKTQADITKRVSSLLDDMRDNLTQVTIRAQHAWDRFNKDDQIFNLLDEFFGEKLDLNVVNARMWPSYLCPYQEDGFCVSSKASLDRMLVTTLYELIHLYWWQVWDKNFDLDDKSSWFLSEMAVETILRNTVLDELFKSQNIIVDNFAHRQFYTMDIRGKNVLDELDSLYAKSEYDIIKFMNDSYKYVHNNFFEIKDKYYATSDVKVENENSK